MNRSQINQYFKVFRKEINFPLTILLTGAAAGSLMGRVRPTLDIDFAVISPKASLKKKQNIWNQVEHAAKQATQATGIAANFTEDIDRWSMIHFLDYKKHTKLYRRFGRLEVRILSPEYWAIGKFARYLDPDVQDLIAVLKRNRVGLPKLTRLLGNALRKSPRSTSQFLFRRQVEHFLKTYGARVWGKRFSSDRALQHFYGSARIPL